MQFSRFKLKNLDSIEKSTVHRTLATPAGQLAMARARASMQNDPVKAVDCLRALLQKRITADIAKVMENYVAKFFGPALRNARFNLGSDKFDADAILDDVLSTSVRTAAENLYESKKEKIALKRTSSMDEDEEDEESEDIVDAKRLKLYHRSKENQPQQIVLPQQQQILQQPLIQDGLQPNQILMTPEIKPDISLPISNPINAGASKVSQNCTDLILVSKTGKPVRREGASWDPATIKSDTLFILGAKANKALGFGQTRGRLYMKHPELFKYSGDQEDKEWLNKNGHVISTGGKAYLMRLSDILALTDSESSPGSAESYRKKLQPSELVGFTLPEFILRKMRAFAAILRTPVGVSDEALLKQVGSQYRRWEAEKRRFPSDKFSNQDILLHPTSTDAAAGGEDFLDEDSSSEISEDKEEIESEIRQQKVAELVDEIRNEAENNVGQVQVVEHHVASASSHEVVSVDDVDLGGLLNGVNLSSLDFVIDGTGEVVSAQHLSEILSLAEDDEHNPETAFPDLGSVVEASEDVAAPVTHTEPEMVATAISTATSAASAIVVTASVDSEIEPMRDLT